MALVERMLAGPAARMAARQSQKRYLPTAYITERMPAGSKSLERVPSLAAGTVEDELERRSMEIPHH